MYFNKFIWQLGDDEVTTVLKTESQCNSSANSRFAYICMLCVVFFKKTGFKKGDSSEPLEPPLATPPLKTCLTKTLTVNFVDLLDGMDIKYLFD